jgi:hypothetical protein
MSFNHHHPFAIPPRLTVDFPLPLCFCRSPSYSRDLWASLRHPYFYINPVRSSIAFANSHQSSSLLVLARHRSAPARFGNQPETPRIIRPRWHVLREMEHLSRSVLRFLNLLCPEVCSKSSGGGEREKSSKLQDRLCDLALVLPRQRTTRSSIHL